ncbi:MAG TPA: acetate/propionate family kinase [Solirubrobacteraceae bacterium]|nr:acetate/propionate family kinase [Solirubrobacteraceae bacterium]
MVASESRRARAGCEDSTDERRILVVNTGSSSVKLGLFAAGRVVRRIGSAEVDRVGPSSAGARDSRPAASPPDPTDATAHQRAFRRTLRSLVPDLDSGIDAIGHRIVHGGRAFTSPTLISPSVLAVLRELVSLAPDHLPQAIAAAETLVYAAPSIPQVACFDTAFHQTLPPAARAVALPRRLGIERFGFHGLSFEYALARLRSIDACQADGRVIVAHLGSGASMAAVRHGRCMETTMGFTPAGGLVMGTRPGDLDPGMLIHLAQDGATAGELQRLINREAGLLALSELSSDMQELLGTPDPRAELAVDVFCYQARKFVGALASVLDGLDSLVFTGGIGANAAEVRTRICTGLGHLGVELDPGANAADRDIVSARDSAVTVRVIVTDEELMVARHTNALVRDTPGRTQRRNDECHR